jgi:hypothetical protein
MTEDGCHVKYIPRASSQLNRKMIEFGLLIYMDDFAAVPFRMARRLIGEFAPSPTTVMRPPDLQRPGSNLVTTEKPASNLSLARRPYRHSRSDPHTERPRSH